MIHDDDLTSMSREQLIEEVKKLRAGIREHRDATGHDLCWYVPELWNLLPEKLTPEPSVPPKEEFITHCKLYHDSLDRNFIQERINELAEEYDPYDP